MKTKRIAKILGVSLVAVLAFSLGAFALPVSADSMEWSTINTPSWEDNVILPGSDLRDMAIGGNGDVIYVVATLGLCRDPGWDDAPCLDDLGDYGLFKSEDGGVTWSDITQNVYEAAGLPPCDVEDFNRLYFVAVAPDDEDWVAVVGESDDAEDIWVAASMDGGDNFSFAGVLEDTANGTEMERVYDIAVSPEVDSIHNIAVAGEVERNPYQDPNADGSVYRLGAGTWLTGSWEDTAYYDGWDDMPTGGPDFSDAVIAVEFSPNFDIDDTIVFMSVDDTIDWDEGLPWLQQGTWGTDNSWNAEAGFSDAVQLTSNGDTLYSGAGDRSMGFALPMDYDGSDLGARALYCYVNAYNTTTELTGGFLFRVDDGSVSKAYGPKGDPLLASIDFHGDADTGKMMVGEYVQWENVSGPLPGYAIDDPQDGLEDCAGVRVWHTVELDPCCPDWELACKSPSGLFMAVVGYTADGDKAYAITGGSDMYPGGPFGAGVDDGGPGDETAFSVSLDDGVSFNQLGLIDTDIDYISDMAVCPDCSVIYMSTINNGPPPDEDPLNCSEHWYSECDSIWRSYDNGDTWERIFHGDWINEGGELLLRLPCDETEDCCTVYLGVQGTDELFYSRDCGQCWTTTPGTKIDIQDVTVETENVVYVLDADGNVSMSTQYGRRWSDAGDTGIGDGHTITSCCLDDMVVVGGTDGGPIAFSEDGGDSWSLTDDLPGDATGAVHLACDPNCPGTIYAAVSGEGIYRTTTDSGAWTSLNAEPLDYYGIVVARTGGALYASYIGDVSPSGDDCDDKVVEQHGTGVARNLDPCDTACCGAETWDYLEAGLGDHDEEFGAEPSALKICGCLSLDTPSILWAIDSGDHYDVVDGSDGQIWTYEDCTAKTAPALLSPVCGADIDSAACEGCTNVDINLCWEKICDACEYDIAIATDEDFNQTVMAVSVDCFPPASCADPCYLIPSGALQAGTTYYWRVRVSKTETGEYAKSQWSETCSFNVAAGVGAGVFLLAPDNGDMGVQTASVGFSWSGVGGATSYSFVLSPNSDLSGALVSEELSGTAMTYTGTLDNSTPYFWQVTAWKDGSILSTSDIGAFTTAGEPAAPPEPPAPPAPAPEIVIPIPPAQQITPNWIYAVIAIGAALAVLVIVLILRTRRP